MRIAILTPSITSADAVSNDVLGMHRVLQKLADTRVFAEGWTLSEPRILPATKIGLFLKKPTDILIYHYSRGWEPGLALLNELNCRKVIKYHNVTPPEFFTRFSSDLVHMCVEGRKQLKLIASAGCDLYLSASAYNERDLLEEGVNERKSFVVPPFHHTDRLNAIKADQKILTAYKDDQTNILMVGRVAPNKGHAALIEAFAAYHRDYNPNSRLMIVGKQETRLNTYNRLLRKLAKYLRVQDAITFAGEVSESALKAYYAVADIFMITSEHEGFCVPLVEAMSMGIPIVAYASSAIPDTVGDVGLVWEERNPYLLAQSINCIIEDRSISTLLGEKGRQRYRELFTNQQIENRLIDALQGVL